MYLGYCMYPLADPFPAPNGTGGSFVLVVVVRGGFESHEFVRWLFAGLKTRNGSALVVCIERERGGEKI